MVHASHIHTPFKSFLPEACKMSTYLEAIRSPKAHMVNTLTMGITAISIDPNTDSPPAAVFCWANKSLSTAAIATFGQQFQSETVLKKQEQSPGLNKRNI